MMLVRTQGILNINGLNFKLTVGIVTLELGRSALPNVEVVNKPRPGPAQTLLLHTVELTAKARVRKPESAILMDVQVRSRI